LARGGVNVHLTLRDPGSPSGGDDRRHPAPRGGGPAPGEGATAAALLPTTTAGQIHLVL